MAKGYSVRKTTNYCMRNGKWKGHSSSIWDARGYTRTWPTVEAAEEAARERMSYNTDPNTGGYIQYCKIYLGKEFIKVVER